MVPHGAIDMSVVSPVTGLIAAGAKNRVRSKASLISEGWVDMQHVMSICI